MAAKPLILVANPGSSSRKYALFEAHECRAQLHFEYEADKVICNLSQNGQNQAVDVDLHEISGAIRLVLPLLKEHSAIADDEVLAAIGLRIVAPSSHFLKDHQLTAETINQLEDIKNRAPLHITAGLDELRAIQEEFADTPVYGISDSSFHATKPDYAWNYGLPLGDADRLDIKRFGYHGLAAASAVRLLQAAGKLTPKLVIVHLGSGASVTAVKNGRSLDNTMGYSPLEGLVMATRSGSIDVTAAHALLEGLNLPNQQALDTYLNHSSGLLGLGGSDDIRTLLQAETAGDHRAELAINTYVFAVQKAIGSMAAVLGGIDQLVFTGTVGERSAPIRSRIVHNLGFIDFVLNTQANRDCISPRQPTRISRLLHSKPIHVLPIDEAVEINHSVLKLLD